MLSTYERTISLSGVYGLSSEFGRVYDLKLPGTLDESGIGFAENGEELKENLQADEMGEPFDEPDDFFEELELESEHVQKELITDRYVRSYRFDGMVRASRMVSFSETPGKRLFLEAERARVLRLFIDNIEIMPFQPATLISPYLFEITGRLNGDHMLTLSLSNAYEGLPGEGILNSNTASQETQTNWNGVLGTFRLREEEPAFISRVRIVKGAGRTAAVEVEVSSDREKEAVLGIASEALKEPVETTVQLKEGKKLFLFEGLELAPEVKFWDEGEGELYEFEFSLNGYLKHDLTGFRELSVDQGGRILLNGRRIFVSGETEFLSFPETGHEPMDQETWQERFLTLQKYGINTIRFQSHCPPEGAFRAADELGMLLFVELSQAECEAFASEEARHYYETEILSVIRTYGNHPSFCFLSFGDHLTFTETGRTFARSLIEKCRRADPNRLYAVGSSSFFETPFTEADGDFCPMPREKTDDVPSSLPFIETDAGMHRMLPDFKEADQFSGLLRPATLLEKRRKVEEKNLIHTWQRYLEASVENAVFHDIRDIEEARLNERLSGIVMMAVHDYPGKGGIFSGLLNSHFQPKMAAGADPKRLMQALSPVMPAVRLSRHTFEYGEILEADVFVINYSHEDVEVPLEVEIRGAGFAITGSLPEKLYPTGRATPAGHLKTELRRASDTDPEEPEDLMEPCEVTLYIRCGKYVKEVPLYIYPTLIPLCPEHVMEADTLSPEAVEWLENGGTVFLTPVSSEAVLPGSVDAYEAYRNAADEAGTRGMYIDSSHPVFAGFPTENCGDFRWEALMDSRAVVLKTSVKTMILELDSEDRLRTLSRLFEARVSNGNVLFSTLGLKQRIGRPEVRALLQSIYDYLDSYDFSPVREMSLQELKSLLQDQSGGDVRG